MAKACACVQTLLDVLLRRTRDKSATVRSKALHGISKALAAPLEGLSADHHDSSEPSDKLIAVRAMLGPPLLITYLLT